MYEIETEKVLDDSRVATVHSTLEDVIIGGIPFIQYIETFIPFKFRGNRLPRRVVPQLSQDLRDSKDMPSIDFINMDADNLLTPHDFLAKYHPEFLTYPSLARQVWSAGLNPSVTHEAPLVPPNSWGVYVWFPTGKTSANYGKTDEEILDMVCKHMLSYIKGKQ
jgi:hypothetical protein